MTKLIAKLSAPKDCAVFKKSATERGRPDVAIAARKRGVENKAIQHGARTDVERECLEAVLVYEQVRSAKSGEKTRASHIWSIIERNEILEAVERAVTRKAETVGYTALVEVGFEYYAFEGVTLRPPSSFQTVLFNRSQERTNQNHGT